MRVGNKRSLTLSLSKGEASSKISPQRAQRTAEGAKKN
jgi:hypothetical protein